MKQMVPYTVSQFIKPYNLLNSMADRMNLL